MLSKPIKKKKSVSSIETKANATEVGKIQIFSKYEKKSLYKKNCNCGPSRQGMLCSSGVFWYEMNVLHKNQSIGKKQEA